MTNERRGTNGRPSTEMVLTGKGRDETIERVVVHGDIRGLSPDQRAHYYLKLCESIGVNAALRPFEYLELDGKMVLYARKECTDQLRAIHGVSVRVTSRERIGDVYVVTAEGKDAKGRVDESTGAVGLTVMVTEWSEQRKKRMPARDKEGEIIFRAMRPDEMANALMKAETKAKRRVTLSLCGIGVTDESEVADMPDAKPLALPEAATPARPEPVVVPADAAPAQAMRQPGDD